MKKLLIIGITLFYSTIGYSQQFVPCATDEVYRESIIKNPGLFKIEDAANEQIRNDVNSIVMSKTGTIRYIPVVFHIIHGNGFENISQAQIMDQLRVLNEDYRKLIGSNGFSSNGLAADMELEFRLAQYDPNGNKSDGINRINNSSLDSNAGDATKALITWDSQRYLNIWVVNSINSAMAGGNGTVLGYAQFPWQLSSQGSTDGIIVRADQVGMVGFADAAQAGRTLSHEIGHWLGLYHTFQGGCVGNTASTCNTKGDQVCDTPPVSAASFGCQTGKNSCTNDVPDSVDLINDYMDYSDGTCMNLFTNGQKTRVYSCMSYRTGIFGTSPNYVQNLAYAGLNTDGTYKTVTASTIKAPYYYGFEELSPVASKWRINNFNNPNNGWQVNTAVSHSGTNSFYMHNFTNYLAKVNSRDGFQTPEIDITGLAKPTLEFYYAYAQKSTASNDSFNVRISNDFGMHEDIIYRNAGEAMSTSGIVSTEYTPAVQEWRKVTVDLSAYKTFTNARVRFEFLNRRGNNIYVDDFILRDGPTGIEELKNDIQFQVYPNPMTETSSINFNLKSSLNLQIKVLDVLGKEILSIPEKEYSSGQHQLQISRAGLTTGIYFIRVEAGNSAFSHKLLIN